MMFAMLLASEATQSVRSERGAAAWTAFFKGTNARMTPPWTPFALEEEREGAAEGAACEEALSWTAGAVELEGRDRADRETSRAPAAESGKDEETFAASPIMSLVTRTRRERIEGGEEINFAPWPELAAAREEVDPHFS